MRRCIGPGITQFSDDFNDGALSALSGHARRGKEIDAFFLIKRANHNLKLWIGENAGQSKYSRGGTGDLPKTWHQKRIERVGTDCKIAALVAGSDRILSDRNSGRRINERKIRRIRWYPVSGCST